MDPEELADDFEGAGAAARDFADALDELPGRLDKFTTAATQAGQAARSVGQGFSSFTSTSKQAGQGADGVAQRMKALGQAAVNVGATIAALATGAIPSATAMGQQLGQALGGALTGAADKAADALGKLGPEGQAAGAALQAVAAVAAATIGTLTTLVGLAIDTTQKLGLMTDRFGALAGSAAGGAAITAMVQRLGETLPFATAQIGEWAAALQRAGFEGKNLEAATKAVAAAAALNPLGGGAQAVQDMLAKLNSGGKEAADMVKAIAENGRKAMGPLRDMGVDINDLGGKAAVAKMNAAQLSAAIEKTLVAKANKGPFADMALQLPDILQKAREGLLSAFEPLAGAVKPFMQAIKGLFGEFNRSGVGANMLKAIVVPVFSTLFEWATKAVNAIHKGFLIVAVAALTAYIAVRPIIEKIKEFAASANFITGLKVALVLLATPFVIIAAVIGIVIVVVGALVAAFGALVAGVTYVVGAIANFVAGAAGALASWVAGAASAASDFVSGLVQGISAGAGAVVAAVKGLASSALAGFTGVFGIKSPSTVMRKHGKTNIAEEGLAKGVDQGAPKVRDAMARLGPDEKGGGKAKASAGGDGGPREVHYHYSGPVEHYPTFRENMRRFLEETRAEAPGT